MSEKLLEAMKRVSRVRAGERAKIVYGFEDEKMDDFNHRMLENAMTGDLSILAHAYIDMSSKAEDVVNWASAILTALNTGDIQSGSLLHLKLREVMIAYRAAPDESRTPDRALLEQMERAADECGSVSAGEREELTDGRE